MQATSFLSIDFFIGPAIVGLIRRAAPSNCKTEKETRCYCKIDEIITTFLKLVCMSV